MRERALLVLGAIGIGLVIVAVCGLASTILYNVGVWVWSW